MSSKTIRCGYCAYSWISRVSSPKSCPRCKRRFDYEEAKIAFRRIGKEFGLNIASGMRWQTKS